MTKNKVGLVKCCSILNAAEFFNSLGYKQTFQTHPANVRFTPESGHPEAQERVGLKKRTSNVRSTPKSGRKWLWRGMSAFDPKRTCPALDLSLNKCPSRLLQRFRKLVGCGIRN